MGGFFKSTDVSSANIHELSFDEVDTVNGGVIPMIYAAYISIGVAGTALAAGSAWVAGTRIGYAVNRHVDYE